ncbi:hypothetical protein [Bradyrhizobium sp. F1.13.3]|uniref:hypothetical protein n=1 Tax=Bradyrhizobium sp. F1.13.3 TaxID=3156351 RepID=UPI00339B1F65
MIEVKWDDVLHLDQVRSQLASTAADIEAPSSVRHFSLVKFADDEVLRFKSLFHRNQPPDQYLPRVRAGRLQDVASERRRNVYTAQTLVEGSQVRCKVRHLSDSSAIVQIDNAPFVPEAFGLRVPSAGLDIDCSVVWRDERRLAVKFLN